jgi:hypothetical protein
MKTIRGEADRTEGFTIRVLLSMGPVLAEALSAVQSAVIQYNALATAHGIQACPKPAERMTHRSLSPPVVLTACRRVFHSSRFNFLFPQCVSLRSGLNSRTTCRFSALMTLMRAT